MKSASSFRILLLACLCGLSQLSVAQSEETNEYYESFDEMLTTRFYFSRKFTNLRINDRRQEQTLLYVPGSTLNMGVGATYNWLTLNLAYGFKFLNPDRYDDTRYLDLQAHAYPKKLVIDLFGQFYKSYDLRTEGINRMIGEYNRPDIVTTAIGANIQYLFNHKKFSFRAAFLQNEWQKKSAGTFLLGFEMYGGRSRGDSSLVPMVLLEDTLRNFTRSRFFEFGPNVGAAYTLVIKRHFFITGSVSGNMSLGYSVQDGDYYRDMQWGVKPNYFLRLFTGYNSSRWSLNANYVLNNLRIVSERELSKSLITGNYRLNFIYRIEAPKRLKRGFDKINIFKGKEKEVQTP